MYRGAVNQTSGSGAQFQASFTYCLHQTMKALQTVMALEFATEPKYNTTTGGENEMLRMLS